MQETSFPDPVVLNEWQVLGAVDELAPNRVRRTRLLGVPLCVLLSAHGEIAVWRDEGNAASGPSANPAGVGERLPVLQEFGYVWTTLGRPNGGLFALPEYFEPDRRNLNAATFGVHVSAPRAVENFLDMGHFPFVHTNYLGIEPHTEVKPYKVEIRDDPSEVLATGCLFYQPRAGAIATRGFEVEYTYRVPHPYCAVLYKSNAVDPQRMDVITLFAQPVDEERISVSMMLSLIDDENSDASIKRFQQTIFAQDKPILENQRPKRLPLDPRAELPVRADASSTAYRRWLRAKGVRYGTIPVNA